MPEPLRDRPVIAIDGAYLGSEADGAELLRPLREVAAPLVMDTFATIPALGLVRLHGDPEEPVPVIADGFQVRELTPEAADAFVEVGGPGSGSPLLMLELRQLGGALAEAAGRLRRAGRIDRRIRAVRRRPADGRRDGRGRSAPTSSG